MSDGRRLGGLALAFAAGAACGAWLAPRSTADRDAPPPAPRASDASAAVASRVAATEAPRAAAPGDAGAAASPGPTPAAGAAPAPPRAMPLGQVTPEFNEMIGRLMAQDRDFEAQQRDDTWAKAQEARLRQLIERTPGLLPTGGTLARLDCRTTMCLIEVRDVPRAADWQVARNEAQRTTEFLESLKYGVSSSVNQFPGVQVDTYSFIVRPDIQPIGDDGHPR